MIDDPDCGLSDALRAEVEALRKFDTPAERREFALWADRFHVPMAERGKYLVCWLSRVALERPSC